MFKNFIKYLVKHKYSRFQIILVTLAMISAIYAFLYYPQPFSVQWGKWIDIFITMSTLSIAVFVWMNEKIENWESALPKKLDITYLLEDRVFANVKNAPLAGDDDIRNWGQSIGQTILNRQTRIEFSGFKTEGPVRNNAKKIMQYKLTVYLFNSISGIKEGEEFYFNDDGNLSETNRERIVGSCQAGKVNSI